MESQLEEFPTLNFQWRTSPQVFGPYVCPPFRVLKFRRAGVSFSPLPYSTTTFEVLLKPPALNLGYPTVPL